jgi:NADP-dependent 3-hydroxy acid dehydrogenase YdfG
MSSTTGAERLQGRAAVVTGASRGIGLETARVLAEAGARVVMVARSADALTQAARRIGDRASHVVCDMSDPDSVQQALQQVRGTLRDGADILVNNAGQFVLAPIERTSVQDFDRTLVVNLTSQFAFIRELVPQMRKRGRGHVVTIGSIADHRAFPENAAYAASKYGARGLHEVLREELRGSGVRATLISPGPVDTTLWDEVNPDERPGFTPRGQMLSAAAVADAVRYVVTREDAVNVDELRLSRS